MRGANAQQQEISPQAEPPRADALGGGAVSKKDNPAAEQDREDAHELLVDGDLTQDADDPVE